MASNISQHSSASKYNLPKHSYSSEANDKQWRDATTGRVTAPMHACIHVSMHTHLFHAVLILFAHAPAAARSEAPVQHQLQLAAGQGRAAL